MWRDAVERDGTVEVGSFVVKQTESDRVKNILQD